MSERDGAPPFPLIRLETLEDLSPETGTGFLRLSRRRLVARYPDGTVSEPFLYDTAERQALDAVVIGAAAGTAEPHAAGCVGLMDTIERAGPVDLERWEPSYGRLAEAQVKWEASHGRALGA